MFRYLLSIVLPPVAMCRYGLAACCAFPIAGIWLGGVLLLGYHFTTTHHINHLTEWGSLVVGAGLVLVSVVWTLLTVMKENADLNAQYESRGLICRRMLPNPDEADPLDEVKRVRNA